MDKASGVLAEGLPEGIPNTYAALAAHSDVPLSTLDHRARGRRSREAKAQSQQYLYPYEENAPIEFLSHQSTLGKPVRMKHIPSLAFSATRQRPPADRPLKPPRANWAKGIERRRLELDDTRGYRGARVKRTIITTIKCISADAGINLSSELDHVSYT
ncbi:hypothetical protein EJ04DRAFT_539366 [Polyplosphaeria fusca]|uniref:Uncharacterized protein n=1 Tax=Polyplosphaeria fusca TaxID=682080 RepID=A0A9P4QHT2_9PLEO|nr:hypothetical protein EJ04DRAFT_539366 [Polyplosphaeria fusca]